ncbi:hypothetical protein YC2023_028630 [Brassica napus]
MGTYVAWNKKQICGSRSVWKRRSEFLKIFRKRIRFGSNALVIKSCKHNSDLHLRINQSKQLRLRTIHQSQRNFISSMIQTTQDMQTEK